MVVAEGGGDGAAVEVGAVGGGDAEVAGDGLEGMAFHGAVGDIVKEREQIGIHDMPSVEAGARIGDDAFGGVEAGGMGGGRAAVAAEGQLDAVAFGAGLDVGQVEAEEIVAGEDIGVALPDDVHEPLQEGFFVEVAGVEEFFPALSVREGDGEDAVLLAVGVGKVAFGGAVGFDVHEEEFQIREQEVAEGGAAGGEKELLDGVAQDEVGGGRVGGGAPGGFAQMGEGAFEGGPGRKAGQPAVGMRAVEAHDFRGGLEAVEELGFGEPEKRGKGFPAGGELAVAPEKQGHGVGFVAGGVFKGDQSGFGGESVNELVAGKRLHVEKHMKLRHMREALLADLIHPWRKARGV